MVGRVVGVLSGFLSIFIFLFGETGSNIQLTPLKIALLCAFILSIILYSASEIREYLANRPITTNTDSDFYAFMVRWLEHPGKVAILSSNLSWGSSQSVVAQLEKKATTADLTLIMERPSDLSRRLEELGASVSYYESLGYTPLSRYTIVRFKSPHGKVAVGWPKKESGSRLIREQRMMFIYGQGFDPFFTAASDLVEMLERSLSQRKEK